MSETVLKSLYQGAWQLDRFRSQLLAWSLQKPFLRSLFLNRKNRLMVFFLIQLCIVIYFTFSAPLSLLLLGPIVFGVPHIISSVRYTPYLLEKGTNQLLSPDKKKSIYWGLMILMSLFFLSHIPFMLGQSVGSLFGVHAMVSLDILFGLFLFLLFSLYFKISTLSLLSVGILLSGIFSVFYIWPGLLSTSFLILHHFKGFYYWYRIKENRNERRLVVGCLLLFSLFHGLLFLGVFDGVVFWFAPADSIPSARYYFKEIGQSTLPYAQHPIWWLRGLLALVFGQAIHYFIWLKAIPEFHLSSEKPVSFRQSLHYFVTDFGALGTLILFGMVALFSIFWVTQPIYQVLPFFFSISNFHFYMELVAVLISMVTSFTHLKK